jgi:hypothetical protein
MNRANNFYTTSRTKHPKINPPHPPEAVKKLLQVERAGRDIEKVLERYLFGLTTYNETLR